jgi:predicted HTH transcriptional regulator
VVYSGEEVLIDKRERENWLMWNEEELRQLIAHGETTTVELKVAPPRPTELAERFCGMANAQGGTLIIGVEDGSLKIVGVQDARAAVDVALRATRLIHPLLVLDPPEPEICSLEGKSLIVIGVPAHRGPLYQSGGVFWICNQLEKRPCKISISSKSMPISVNARYLLLRAAVSRR